MSQTYCLNVIFLAESVLIGRVNYLRLEQRKASIVWCETYTPWLARSFLSVVILPLWSAASKPGLARFITPLNWKLCHSAYLGIKPRYCKAFCGEKSSFLCRGCSQLLPVVLLQPSRVNVGKWGRCFSFYIRSFVFGALARSRWDPRAEPASFPALRLSSSNNLG